MTTEDYVSYEVAKLLKEKGFDWMCNGYYNKDDEDAEPYFGDGEGADNWNDQAPSVKDLWCSAPTHQMAMKWLREKDIDIVIMPVLANEYNERKYYIWQAIGTRDKADTYEEAVEAALKNCLTNLI